MPDSGDSAPPAPNDPQLTEQKMRQALGLIGSNKGDNKGNTPQAGSRQPASRANAPRVPQQRADAARGRHRFVQDGGVPVVVLNHRPDDGTAAKEKLADLERQLQHERNAHNDTRRALAEAKAEAREASTRLAHAGIAHQEALNGERRALASAQRALNEALTRLQSSARRTRVEESEATQPEAAPDLSAASPAAIPQAAIAQAAIPQAAIPEAAPAASAAEAAPKKRGRPRTRPLPEPKPVRWWTPSYRAKTKA